jgi:hypothetical protein
LIVAIGLINSVVAEYIWDFSIEISFTQLLFHGIVMSISLLFVNGLLVVLPQFLFPGVLTTLVTFFPAAILDGMAGRYVAEHFSN